MPSASPARSRPAHRVAAAVVSLEALALVALSVLYVIELGEHAEDSRSRVLASIALFIVGAVILASMARGWLRGQNWPRMATLVVNALMVPVALTSIQTWGLLVGVPVLLVAATGVIAALRAGDEEIPDRTPAR